MAAAVCIDDNTAVEFLEGGLSEERVAEVENHAAGCEDCRMLLAALGRDPTGQVASGSGEALSPTLPAAGSAHIDLKQGEVVDRFVILSRLGAGGMGVVFAAYDPRLDRKVALKLLHSAGVSKATPSDALTRLHREAQAIAQLAHPNVIAVYDVGTYKSEVYIAMELVEGDTLTHWLRRWHRSWREILEKFLASARALAAAHARGIAHRDFKPDNVLVGTDERVRVMDFGLARSLYTGDAEIDEDTRRDLASRAASALNHTLTRTGMIVGTPRYMAPELYLGSPADALSDQFSYAVALYEAIYGKHPFAEGNARALAENGEGRKVLPRPPETAVPGWVHDAILRGLEREPRRRFASMELMIAALSPPPVENSRRRWPLAAAAMAVLAAGLAVALIRARQDTEAAEAARDARVASLSGEIRTLEKDVEVLQRAVTAAKENETLIRELREEIRSKTERIVELEKTMDPTVIAARPIARPPPTNQPTARPAAVTDDRGMGERIAAAQLDLEVCLREWGERRPTENARLEVSLTIGPSGYVQTASAAGLPDRVARECVLGSIKRLRFTEAAVLTDAQVLLAYAGGSLSAQGSVTGSRPAPVESASPIDLEPR